MTANTYPYTGPGTRWVVGEPTEKGKLDIARINADHLHEALNIFLDTDVPDEGLYLSIATPMKWRVNGTTTWSVGWWQAGDGSWWLLARAADVASFTRAEADFYIPTGGIGDVPLT